MVEWLPIPGTNGNYFASDEGQVRGRKRQGTAGARLKEWRRDGYAYVSIHANGAQRLRLAEETP